MSIVNIINTELFINSFEFKYFLIFILWVYIEYEDFSDTHIYNDIEYYITNKNWFIIQENNSWNFLWWHTDEEDMLWDKKLLTIGEIIVYKKIAPILNRLVILLTHKNLFWHKVEKIWNSFERKVFTKKIIKKKNGE